VKASSTSAIGMRTSCPDGSRSITYAAGLITSCRLPPQVGMEKTAKDLPANGSAA